LTLGVALAAALAGFGSADAGETTLSIYGGWNGSFNSDMTLKPNGTTPATTYKNLGWDGASFGSPPYWGARAVYWLDPNTSWGFGLDYSHAKVIAERPPALNAIVSHLEFTDGLNLIIPTAYYRYKWTDRFTPYVGLGAGISVPSVEVTLRPVNGFDSTPTHQYELGGPAVQATVGLDAKIWGPISAFGEYKIAYSANDVTIHNGGSEQTNLVTNQVVIGLSYTFK
jgi:lipid A oxidase